MNDKKTEVLKLALEALQEVYWSSRSAKHDEAITALREALAEQPAQHQEPVGTVQCINGVTIGYLDVMQPVGTKLYTKDQL